MGYGYYGIDMSYIVLVMPAILFSLWAQTKVNSTFSKYQRVRCYSGYTGAQIARRILDENGLSNVRVESVSGSLTDHYDPRTHVVRLSDSVYASDSVAAIGVAAHECGHAIQHNEGYSLLRLRDNLVPLVNITSGFSWPVVMIGLIMMASGYAFGGTLFNVGVILFGLVVLFHLVTLPVELNASSRALTQMINLGIVNEEEQAAAKKVLSAAAMTYVAALATAIANMLRLIAISGSNRR